MHLTSVEDGVMSGAPASALSHLQCSYCEREYDADILQTYCTDCQSPLLARYDLQKASSSLDRSAVGKRPNGLWRWSEILPVRNHPDRRSLGEGDTPLVRSHRLAVRHGFDDLWIKDESTNPTGTFKARGLAVAVARAVELGVDGFVIPTAGNAGGALAAYAARHDVPAHVYMPEDAPQVNQIEVHAHGARLHLVNGLIDEAGKLAGRAADLERLFGMATFREPYRVEGKKTMGLELAEGFDWQLPDTILYPTGGGTGLVGMWKAFQELEALGWIGPARPRMISVQAEGCQPIVRAIEGGSDRAEVWENASTDAGGLRVPGVFADRLVLGAIRDSGGTAIAVSDEAMRSGQAEMAALDGIYPCLEGAATWAAAKALREKGLLDPEERIVLFNTGSGLKDAGTSAS